MTHVQELVESEVKAGLVLSGTLGLHLLHGLFKDLLVTHVSLHQVLKASDNWLRLFIELGKKQAPVLIFFLNIQQQP